jgi:hypothetical protein
MLLGGALGGAALLALLSCGEPEGGGEVPEYRALATESEQREWWGDHERRATPWLGFPDPPGEGAVVAARYWIARAAYPLEIRRRGDRVTLGVHGVDTQIGGGAWTAFGEGHVTGDPGSFRGAVATIAWSCLGVRYRHASDGPGRLEFSEDGRTLVAVYGASEDPTDWGKAYGVLDEGVRPEYGAIEGQIPVARSLARLDDAAHRVALVVRDASGRPIEGARTGLRGAPSTQGLTDAAGRAVIEFRGSLAPVAQEFTAAATGFRTGARVAFTGDLPYARSAGEPAPEVSLALDPLDPTDHPEYRWAASAPDGDPDDVMACGTCHSWQYAEWFGSRHARSAGSSRVEWERTRMLATDPTAPDDCRRCHQPAHAVDSPGEGWNRRGSEAGIHCDFCHKVASVGEPGGGVAGSLFLARPDPASRERPGGIGRVFGTSGDAVYGYMGASLAPALGTSEFCAACHQGGGRADEGGLAKIDTWREWKQWIADGAGGRTRSCQDCHMPAGFTVAEDGSVIDQVAWNSLRRGASALHSHRFEAIGAPFASRALDLVVEKRRDDSTGEWVVRVALRNRDAGHRVPTGTWTKQVAVGVWARSGGRPLRQTGGDRAWLIVEDPPAEALAAGDWRNPGGFVLRVRPAAEDPARASAAFWGAWPPGAIVDERLAPGEVREAVCRFESADEPPEVEVHVVHRRGDLGTGPEQAPWWIGPYDPPPETLWMRVVR